jgi:two-component system OmpR family sensor kinase
LPVPARADELHDLTQALNELLMRLDRGFEALGSYVSAASHELRTPLAVVESQLEVALRHSRSAQEWERVAHVSLGELHRLTKLIAALLELSRADAPLGVERQTTDLCDCVDRAVAGLAAEASRARASIEVHHPQNQVGVRVDTNPDILASAIQELARNAIRHARSGRVHIRYQLDEPQRTIVHVDDCGRGIEPAEREGIFEPFVRGRAVDAGGQEIGRRSSPRGFGLGLSIVKRSIEGCGGRVSVATSPEGGARFSLSLPSERVHS